MRFIVFASLIFWSLAFLVPTMHPHGEPSDLIMSVSAKTKQKEAKASKQKKGGGGTVTHLRYFQAHREPILGETL